MSLNPISQSIVDKYAKNNLSIRDKLPEGIVFYPGMPGKEELLDHINSQIKKNIEAKKGTFPGVPREKAKLEKSLGSLPKADAEAEIARKKEEARREEAERERKEEAERLAEEEAKRLAAKDAEAKRLAAEKKAEIARKKEEAKRLAASEAAKRAREDKRLAKEAAEAKRLAKEAAESKRLADVALYKRLAEEAEAKRLAEEAKKKILEGMNEKIKKMEEKAEKANEKAEKANEEAEKANEEQKTLLANKAEQAVLKANQAYNEAIRARLEKDKIVNEMDQKTEIEEINKLKNIQAPTQENSQKLSELEQRQKRLHDEKEQIENELKLSELEQRQKRLHDEKEQIENELKELAEEQAKIKERKTSLKEEEKILAKKAKKAKEEKAKKAKLTKTPPKLAETTSKEKLRLELRQAIFLRLAAEEAEAEAKEKIKAMELEIREQKQAEGEAGAINLKIQRLAEKRQEKINEKKLAKELAEESRQYEARLIKEAKKIVGENQAQGIAEEEEEKAKKTLEERKNHNKKFKDLNDEYSNLPELKNIQTRFEPFNLTKKKAFLNQSEKDPSGELFQEINNFNDKLSTQNSLGEEYEQINKEKKTFDEQLETINKLRDFLGKTSIEFANLISQAAELENSILDQENKLKSTTGKQQINAVGANIRNLNKDLKKQNKDLYNKSKELEDFDKEFTKNIDTLETNFKNLKTKRQKYLDETEKLNSSSTIDNDKENIDNKLKIIKRIPNDPEEELARIRNAIEVLIKKLETEELKIIDLKNLFKSDQDDPDSEITKDDLNKKLENIKTNFGKKLRKYFQKLIKTKTDEANKELEESEKQKNSVFHRERLNFYLDENSIIKYIKLKNKSMKVDKEIIGKISNLKAIEKAFIHTDLWDDFYDVIEEYKKIPNDIKEIDRNTIKSEIDKFLTDEKFSSDNMKKAQQLALQNDSSPDVFKAIRSRFKTLIEDNEDISKAELLFSSVLPDNEDGIEKLAKNSGPNFINEYLNLFVSIIEKFKDEERDNELSYPNNAWELYTKIKTNPGKNSMYEALVYGIFTDDDFKKNTFINTLRLRAILLNFFHNQNQSKAITESDENKETENLTVNNFFVKLELTELSEKIEEYFNKSYKFGGTEKEILEILFGKGIKEMFEKEKINFIYDTWSWSTNKVNLLINEEGDNGNYSYYTKKNEWKEKTSDLATRILFRPILNYSLPPTLKTYQLQK